MPSSLPDVPYDVSTAADIVQLHREGRGSSLFKPNKKPNKKTDKGPKDIKKSKSSLITKEIKELDKQIDLYNRHIRQQFEKIDYSKVPYPSADRVRITGKDRSGMYFVEFEHFVDAVRFMDKTCNGAIDFKPLLKILHNIAEQFKTSSLTWDDKTHENVGNFIEKIFNKPIPTGQSQSTPAPKPQKGQTPQSSAKNTQPTQYQNIKKTAPADGTPPDSKAANPQKEQSPNSSAGNIPPTRYESIKITSALADGTPPDSNEETPKTKRKFSRRYVSIQVPSGAGDTLKDKDVKLLPIHSNEMQVIKNLGAGVSGTVDAVKVISNMKLKKKLALPAFVIAFIADKKYWVTTNFLSELKLTCENLNLFRMSNLIEKALSLKTSQRTSWLRNRDLDDIRCFALLIAKHQREHEYQGNIRHLVRMELNKAIDIITDNEAIEEVFHTRQKNKNWFELPVHYQVAWEFLNEQLGYGSDIEILLDSIDSNFFGLYNTLKLTGRLDCPIVAVKKANDDSDNLDNDLLKEAWISPNYAINSAAAFYIAAKEGNTPLLVTTFRELGSLENILKNNMSIEDESISEKDLLFIIYDVARGLAALNKRHIIHRDIAPRNILLYRDKDGQLRAEIADYGLATKIGKNLDQISLKAELGQEKQPKFPTQTTPPETLREKITHLKSDIWQFALLVQQLLSETQTPFDLNMDEQQVQCAIKIGQLKPGIKIDGQTTAARRALAEIVNQIGQAESHELRPEWNEILSKLEEYVQERSDLDDNSQPTIDRATGYGLLPSSLAKLASIRSLSGNEPYSFLPPTRDNGEKQEQSSNAASSRHYSFFRQPNNSAHPAPTHRNTHSQSLT